MNQNRKKMLVLIIGFSRFRREAKTSISLDSVYDKCRNAISLLPPTENGSGMPHSHKANHPKILSIMMMHWYIGTHTVCSQMFMRSPCSSLSVFYLPLSLSLPLCLPRASKFWLQSAESFEFCKTTTIRRSFVLCDYYLLLLLDCVNIRYFWYTIYS